MSPQTTEFKDVDQLDQYAFPAFDPDAPRRRRQSESTVDDESTDEYIDKNKLHVHTSYDKGPERLHTRGGSPMSPYQQKQSQQLQLDDELEMLKAESTVNQANEDRERERHSETLSRTRSLARTRSKVNTEPADEFDIGTTPVYEQTKVYQPPAKPATRLAKMFIKVHQSSFIVRYLCYITPIALVILVPLLLGAFLFKDATVGDVRLMWFCIWLEIFWLTLWLGRIIAKCIPYPVGLIATIFTNSEKVWRDMARQLEVPIALFFWWLAVEVSFLPTMVNHHSNGDKATRGWETTMNKVIISIFICATLNFIEKIIIQLIAISFHLRTYADRIEINKFQTSSLVKLYVYSRQKIAMKDSDFEAPSPTSEGTGLKTPLKYINKAGKGVKQGFNRVGNVAGRVAVDFAGREAESTAQPQQVVNQLLSSTSGSQVLARRLHRTFTPEGAETVADEDLAPAFDNNEEADAAFGMFDKDMNGDISMEELEAVCVEIGRERKAITASLKDLDSVVGKLDDLFLFIVAVITILVFISLISTSAAGVLTSAGSAVLALSWLFSVTAQEVLQSIIFVFVKHPFDVGDRVTIYGNTGAAGLGDDYFVKEIALLFTEFKKMEGHVVQAPNSYLNTLFILNQRRSGGLAEAVPVTMKFGTTIEQLEGLRVALMEFVATENREYQSNILTELRTVYEAYSISMNVVFFYKSNWQNELLRLQRRNKFICALMVAMQDLGIEGPRRTWAGQNPEAPVYMSSHNSYTPPHVETPFSPGSGPSSGPGPGPSPNPVRSPTSASQSPSTHPSTIPSEAAPSKLGSYPSILRQRGSMRAGSARVAGGRKESMGQMSKRVDFSLGMSGISSGADMGDIYDKPKVRVPVSFLENEEEREEEREEGRRSKGDGESLGRTGSRESGRVRSRSRKGVIFGRKSREEAVGGDLEAQVGGGSGGVQMSELEGRGRSPGREGWHLAGIPEVPSRGERVGGVEREREEQRERGEKRERERGRVGSREELIGEKRE
ncbi:hypothetical protein VE02_09419 [Pseudogymnoascus sp. 03VT05]|nr:hypothetical protein VE02_09419 [Pseudogymnoascus sp. 03VT05]